MNGRKEGGPTLKVRLRLTSGSEYEIPSSNDAPLPPRCVTGVRMAPLETVSTDAHPLVENTYRRENKLPSYKCHGTSHPWSFVLLCFVGARHGAERLSKLFICRYCPFSSRNIVPNTVFLPKSISGLLCSCTATCCKKKVYTYIYIYVHYKKLASRKLQINSSLVWLQVSVFNE